MTYFCPPYLLCWLDLCAKRTKGQTICWIRHHAQWQHFLNLSFTWACTSCVTLPKQRWLGSRREVCNAALTVHGACVSHLVVTRSLTAVNVLPPRPPPQFSNVFSWMSLVRFLCLQSDTGCPKMASIVPYPTEPNRDWLWGFSWSGLLEIEIQDQFFFSRQF